MTLNHWNQVIFLETQIPVLGTIVTNWGWKRTASFSPAWLCKRCQESPVRLAWFKFSFAARIPDGVGRTFELWNTIGLSSHLTKFLSFPQRDRNLMRICTFHDCEGQNWTPKLEAKNAKPEKYLNSGYLSVLLNLSLLKKLNSNFSSFKAAVQWNIRESSWQKIR